MDSNRRNLLKASASAAVGSLLAGTQNTALAQAPPRSTRTRRTAPGRQDRHAPRHLHPRVRRTADLVAVLDNGKMIDLQAEAKRQKRALPFEASSMLALIKSGNAGLEQVRMLVEHALAGRPRCWRSTRRASCRRFRGPTATSTASAGTTSTTSKKASRPASTSRPKSCRSTRCSSPRARTR
jgi:hypothetical protein